MIDVGIRVSKKGKNVTEGTDDPRNFSFMSDYDSPKIYKIINGNVGDGDWGFGGTWSDTVAHGLSYVPMAFGLINATGHGLYLQMPCNVLYKIGAMPNQQATVVSDIEMDATNIYLSMSTNNQSVVFDIDYSVYIFLDEIETS